MLVQVVQDDLRDRVPLQVNDQPLAGTRRGLVPDVGDPADAVVPDELGDLLGKVVGVDLVRQLGDNELGPALVLLDLDDGPHPDAAATRAVGVLDALPADDETGGGEVRSLDQPEQRFQQFGIGGVRVREEPLHALGNLPQVVRGNVGRHPDRDAPGTVDQQVREPAGQDRRLLGAAVVVGCEVDRVLVDIAQHLHRQRRQP